MVKARFYSRLLGALAAPDGQEQNGRWEMGKGRWEKGDGDGRCSKGLEPPPSHSPSVPCPRSRGLSPIPMFHPHSPRFIVGPGGCAWNGATGQQQLEVAAPQLKTQ